MQQPAPAPKKGGVRITNMRVSMSPETQPEEHETVVVIDRTNAVLGNRHILTQKSNLRERERVIALHQKDLDHSMKVNGEMAKEIHALAARVRDGERLCLACWCQPSPCHGENYVRAIRQINTEIERLAQVGPMRIEEAQAQDAEIAPVNPFAHLQRSRQR